MGFSSSGYRFLSTGAHAHGVAVDDQTTAGPGTGTDGIPRSQAPASRDPSFSARARRRLTARGTTGNEQLTSATGIVLIVLLAALGVTILRIRPLLSEHMFLGILLIPPVA